MIWIRELKWLRLGLNVTFSKVTGLLIVMQENGLAHPEY